MMNTTTQTHNVKTKYSIKKEGECRCSKCNHKLFEYEGKIEQVRIKCDKCKSINFVVK